MQSSKSPKHNLSGSGMLRLLQSSLDPITEPPRCLVDPILVSIDIGLTPKSTKIQTIGIAILDTRNLSDAEREGNCINKLVTSRLLLLTRKSLPRNRFVRQYLFGIPEPTSIDESREILLATLQQPDEEFGGFRNVLLIGHSVRDDLRYLRQYWEFDIAVMPQITAIIDTFRIAPCMFGSCSKHYSLKHVLRLLSLRTTQLHNSGNDALYTMKALLLLFCEYQGQILQQNSMFVDSDKVTTADYCELVWSERLELLKQIGRSWQDQRTLKSAKRPPRLPRTTVADFLDAGTEDNLMSILFE